ncbi:MAG: tetratricopeptide repeat protein [Elusimicrobiales bacterium]
MERTGWNKFLPLLLAALTAAAFLPSLSNGFTNWDDQLYLTANTAVRSLSPAGVADIFSHFHRGLYKPLVFLSFAVEYHFFGLNPVVYHATNLLFHVCNALLVFWFLFLVTERRGLAFCAALLFSVHPLRVESVAWIAERKDMLSSFFALLALVFHVLRRRRGQPVFAVLSGVMLALSLLANAKAVMLPFIMAVTDIYMGTPVRKSLRDCLPYLGVTVMLGLVNLFALRSADAGARLPSFASPLIASYGFLLYIAKTLLPVHLSVLYPYPKGYPASLPPEYWLAPLAAAVAVWLFIRVTRADAAARYGGAFYAVYIFPFLQWMPVQPGVAMEHLSYFPSIGLSLALAAVFARWRSRAMPAVFAAAIAMLCVLTWQRNKVWKDSFSLWNDRIAAYPDSTVGYLNRGMAWYEAGDAARAIADFTKTAELNPKFRSAYVKRGEAYFAIGDYGKALADARLAVELSASADDTAPSRAVLAEAHFLEGSVLALNGGGKAAEAAFDAALALEPEHPQSLAAKARFVLERGETARAAEMFAKAAGISPLSPDLWNGLGAARSACGDYAAAAASYGRALEINPAYADAWANWAVTCLNSGDLACAGEKLRRAQSLGYRPAPDLIKAMRAAGVK